MGRSTEDDFLDLFAPQQNQIAYQFAYQYSAHYRGLVQMRAAIHAAIGQRLRAFGGKKEEQGIKGLILSVSGDMFFRRQSGNKNFGVVGFHGLRRLAVHKRQKLAEPTVV